MSKRCGRSWERPRACRKQHRWKWRRWIGAGMTRCWKKATKHTVTRLRHWLVKEWRRPMSKDVTKALAACLQELRLPAVRVQYEAVARQASAETWGYPEYLLELLQ